MNTEPSQKGNHYLAARRAAKAALLPRAAQLASEGRSYQEIAAALGIAKSTVCQWLRDRPLGRAAAKALGTPRMTAKLAARYESVYQRALREWNRSKADRRTETVVTKEPAGREPTTTTTVRTEPRNGNAACLGKALAAMKAMEGLHCREQTRLEWLASECGNAAGNDDYLTRSVKTTLTRSGRKARTTVTTRLDAEHLASPTSPLVPSGGTWCPDAQKDANENRLALEAPLDADEHATANDETRVALRAEAVAAEKELRAILARFDAADEETRAAIEVEGTAATERLLTVTARLEAVERAAPAYSSAIAAEERGGEAGGRTPALKTGNAGSTMRPPSPRPRPWVHGARHGARPLPQAGEGSFSAGSAQSMNGSPAGTPQDVKLRLTRLLG